MVTVKKQDYKKEIKNKSERLLEGVGVWASWYRQNPDKFVTEYLGLHLYLFQKILLCVMMMSTNFIFCAARGLG